MPFKSKAQQRAAFGGYLGSEMKAKAQQWADETPNIKNLPEKKLPGKIIGYLKKKKKKMDMSGGHHDIEFKWK